LWGKKKNKIEPPGQSDFDGRKQRAAKEDEMKRNQKWAIHDGVLLFCCVVHPGKEKEKTRAGRSGGGPRKNKKILDSPQKTDKTRRVPWKKKRGTGKKN